ncbi:pentatricopeptide repeat-containing protein At5g39680 [Punica granatum]|uniref:Pentatricopeptide repeat-containing protein At5g39680 n=1 Tax=Punica granatum TaxID=22663 RepID=A0A6P8C2J5_PUNGR|nr:pentatricopeptide repeat-containing protein At5g39680 [Punica granatum]
MRPSNPRLFLYQKYHVPSILECPSKLLKASADSKSWNLGRAVHARLIVSDKVPQNDITHNNYLINFYSKCGQMCSVRNLFDRMPERNVVSWSALMAGYLHKGLPLEVLGLFKTMLSADARPNEYVLATVIASCSNSGRDREGEQSHGCVVKCGLEHHQYVRNALISLYLSCSDVEAGLQVFSSWPVYDIFTYNSLINGLLENEYFSEALQVFTLMVKEGVFSWDGFTFSTAFSFCASIKDLRLATLLHCRLLKAYRVVSDVFLCSALVDTYGKCGKVSYAIRVFDQLPKSNVVTWTSVMAVQYQNGCFEKALDLFPRMMNKDIRPNDFTFAILLNSCGGLSALRTGDILHAMVHKLGFGDHTDVGNALMHMYSKSGDIEASKRAFQHMNVRNPITWNSMICGYSHHGLGNEALSTFEEMVASGELPNYVTFVGVLSACGHLGLVHEGLYILNHLMPYYGIRPGIEHCTCVIGLFCKAGLLEDAEKFMRSTPIKWDIVAWRTLLSACHNHKKYGLGKRIAEVVLGMDPNDVGTYVLVSNMYAKAKRWDQVANIRKMMRDQSIKKEPGVSWIEIENMTHVFVSDDNKHPEYLQILEKVGELLSKIKKLGYVPDIAMALHDVEDEQKEDHLSYHSEKLAIAYGLLKMPRRVPLRVFKNLRMCDDCHSAVKLISKAERRVIIVRDVNRFHHFQEGRCSCGDYW